MENDIKDPDQAWKELKEAMIKEKLLQKVITVVACLSMVNWLLTMFYGWYLHPHLTQMEVLMHSLDFFEWNFEIAPVAL